MSTGRRPNEAVGFDFHFLLLLRFPILSSAALYVSHHGELLQGVEALETGFGLLHFCWCRYLNWLGRMIEGYCLRQQGGRGEREMELLAYAELCYIAPHLVVGGAVGEHGDEAFLQVSSPGAEEWGCSVRTPHMSKFGKRGVSAEKGLQ